MPELPEVETIKRGLEVIKNLSIVNIIVRNYRLRWPIPQDLELIARNQKIIAIKRRAKYLLLQTTNATIIIHLGMSGSIRIVDANTALKKHDHVDFLLSNGLILRYNDPRRFGAILWTISDPYQHILLKNIGIEPLEENFNGEYLYNKASKRNMPIKSFIMDSKIVAGVGNIYAAEALFLSKINPKLPAKNLTLQAYNILAQNIKKVLTESIKSGGTTLKDYVNSEGKPGYFAQKLYVYGRANLECITCKSTLQSVNIGQRSTVFCGECQAI